MPHLVDGGVPTFKAFMVYDFGVDDATLLGAARRRGERGGMLEVHCENRTILEALTARHLAAGETGAARSTRPRGRRTSRPRRPAGRSRWREAAEAPLYVVHLSSAAALAQVRRGARRRAGACSPRRARTT